jgi:hypothetical protein
MKDTASHRMGGPIQNRTLTGQEHGFLLFTVVLVRCVHTRDLTSEGVIQDPSSGKISHFRNFFRSSILIALYVHDRLEFRSLPHQQDSPFLAFHDALLIPPEVAPLCVRSFFL